MRSEQLNGGAYCRTAFQAINKTATAGGAGDNAEVNGDWVSRFLDKAVEGGIAMSAKLVIAFTAALGQGETLTFAAQFQDADDVAGAGAADYGDAVPATTVATGGSGGSTETGTVEIDIGLSKAREFIRAQVTPDLSAANTDTCEWAASLVFFGGGRPLQSRAMASVGGPA